MPYLQLDIPNRYPLDLKRDLARRLSETFAHIMQTTTDRVTVAFRELGEDRCQYIPLNAAAEQLFCDAICAFIREPSPRPVALPQLSARFVAEQYVQLYQSLLHPASAMDAPALRASMRASEGNHAI